jgi:GT2 family glycosyltransferase
MRDIIENHPDRMDKSFYLQTNPDVLKSNVDPVTHFLQFGWKESRLPYRVLETPLIETLVPPIRGWKQLEPLGENPDIHAIIPTIWQKPELTKPLLQWLVSHGVHCTVVDNRSSGADVCAEAIQDVQIIRDAKPFNFSRLCNLGYRTAFPNDDSKTGIALFMNDDLRVVDDQWLSHLIAAFNDQTIGCAGPVSINPDGSVQGMGAVCRVDGSGVIGLHDTDGRSVGNGVVECESIGGPIMAFRVEAFPWLDEGYRITHSDNIVCFDVRAAGYRVVTALNSRIEHHEKSSRAQLGDPVDDIRRFWSTRWANIMGSAPRAKCSVYQRDLIRVEDVHDILVIKLDHIGDIFIARNALTLLKNKFPAANITIICASFAVGLFQRLGYKTITCDFWSEGGVTAKLLGLSSDDKTRLQSLSADIAIDFRVATEGREVLNLVKARWKFAYGTGLLTHVPANMSNKKQLDMLVESIDVWDKGTIENANGIIGLNRHASAEWKKWGLWDRLVEWLSKNGIPFKEYGPGMCAIEDFAEMVASECRVYVGQDTGPTHAVAATGLPIVEIMGNKVPVNEWMATGNVLCLDINASVMDVIWAIGNIVT